MMMYHYKFFVLHGASDKKCRTFFILQAIGTYGFAAIEK